MKQLSKAQIEAIKAVLADYELTVSVKRAPRSNGVSLRAWKPETAAGRACKANMLRWQKVPPIEGVKNYKIRDWRGNWLNENHSKFAKAMIYRREMDRREREGHHGHS